MPSICCCNPSNFSFRGSSGCVLVFGITLLVLTILFNLRTFGIIPRPPHWSPVAATHIKVLSPLMIVGALFGIAFYLYNPPRRVIQPPPHNQEPMRIEVVSGNPTHQQALPPPAPPLPAQPLRPPTAQEQGMAEAIQAGQAFQGPFGMIAPTATGMSFKITNI